MISTKYLWLLLVAGATSAQLSAQNEVDALRYSFTDVPGSSRSLGMGGAFGALGADFSSFFTNPAGIGMYKRGGVEFGLGFSDQKSSSSYENGTAENGRANLTIPGFGVVSSHAGKGKALVSTSFGVAYSKLRNFNEHITIRGFGNNTTLLDVFASQANGTADSLLTDAFPFGAGLAWETYLIDPHPNSPNTYIPVVSGIGDVLQSKTIERSGSMAETAFGFGTNYADRLYFGLTVSFQSINFREKSTYTESFGTFEELDHFTFTEDLTVKGTGIGLKIGTIARVTEWLRLGVAYHTRTAIGITDSYLSSMQSRFRLGDGYEWNSPINVANYNLRSPSRFIGSAAFILGDNGVVTADYEYVDFSSMNMRGTYTNNYDYNAENETIRTIYRATHRARAGVELRMMDVYRLRFGASYAQSPFINGVAINTSRWTYSAGGGYRKDAFSLDVAAFYRAEKESYYLYNPEEVSEAVIDNQRIGLMVSAGIRF